ncbi:glycoside hydrolase family 16 protein [Macrolepiota fuliginosa MF-IS2]|uniref:Glycoside hydrolase family 16 protein n=1 Tax=Macrolepiota fuliginosa MF-IS2 TaxID=1400762 RepID=A0A9P5XFQ1_9AGAR|nr:glycoside hydrolase family 16 protein [Macrolepiota fuliginosa MF-IS2]
MIQEEDRLAPPQPRFAATDVQRPTHSRPTTAKTMSSTQSYAYGESPPSTSHNNADALSNPFSPPGSTTNFDVVEQQFPETPPTQHIHTMSSDSIVSAPRSGFHSVSTSAADLSRGSYSLYGSRPGTASSRLRESFASPKPRPMTMYNSVQQSPVKFQRERPKSTMLAARGPVEKPWISTRDPYARLAYFLTYGVMLLGVAAGAIRCWISWHDTPVLPGNLCMVMDEDFDSADGIFGENGKFFREVDMSGFGNGEFEMTTSSDNNSYVRNGHLYITPTLTSDAIGADAVVDGHIFNITDCTFNITQGLGYTSSIPQFVNTSAIGMDQAFDADGYYRACSAVSNATSGQIINPVQSARISTKKTASIKYGRVEVVAKIPKGSFWPAIWMLPVDNKYGAWPLSGEIDIMESRGNGIRYPKQGSNYVRGSLNWGPVSFLNRVWQTYGWWTQRRTSYGDDFHTFALEWTEDFIRIYVDTRLHHLLDLRIKESFWNRGDFPRVVQNGSEAVILTNPWSNGSNSAPFDQPFYLIMNVAVGGTNGWFPDGSGDKPWLDGSNTAMGDFWRSKNQWSPTWSDDPEDRSLVV